jgi:hypothetical protein
MALEIAPGTTLSFQPDAYIVVQGAAINAPGAAQAPIRFQGSDGSGAWKGLYVLESPERSTLSHVTVAGTDSLRAGALRLTGGVTFYRADVELDHVSFDGSRAEDALNIVESSFALDNVAFFDVRSDAFDSDFSRGRITATTFERVGGDGLDTSGSDVVAHDLSFADIGDKAVSAGEDSRVSIDGATMTRVGAGIVSKDGSRVTARAVEVSAFELFAAMAYRKKSIYGSAELRIEASGLERDWVFNQAGNTLMLDGTIIAGRDLDVDALYAQGPMRKVQ